MPKIDIRIEMPSTPSQSTTTLCDYVQELIDEVDAGYPSPQAWSSIRRIFNRLARRSRLTPMQKRAFELMEPIVHKYGMNDPRGVDLAAAYPHEGCDTQPKERK